jgi:hypothetical protein
MTKKDYVLIADALADGYRGVTLSHGQNDKADAMFVKVVHRISVALERDNSRFDRIRFEEYIADSIPGVRKIRAHG